MIELSTIRDLVAIFGVIAGFSYYVLTVRANHRNQQQQLETRQAQLFMQIYTIYHSEEFIKSIEGIMKWEYTDYDEYMSKYGVDANPEAHMMYRKLFGYLEGLGVLVRRGFIDASLVDDLMSGAILIYWEKLEPYIVERRKRLNWPQVGEQIEYLYNQVKPIAERQRRELAT